jgi:hypothetical protein
MTEKLTLGLGLRQVIYPLVLMFIILMTVCLILSVFISYNFLAGFFALTPAVLIMTLNSFIYLDGRHFIVCRFFRRDILIEADQFKKLARSRFSIPGFDVLKIEFDNGLHFLFLPGGKTISQVRRDINSWNYKG